PATFVPVTCTTLFRSTWVAKDVCGNTSAVFTQVITVTDTKAPTWTTAAASLDKSVECDDAAGLTAAQALAPVAADGCPGTVTYTKTAGTFVAGTCGGTYTNTWVAKDVCGNTSAVFTQVITVTDTKAPTWTTAAASLDKSVECDDGSGLTAAQALAPVAADGCPGTVTYTDRKSTLLTSSHSQT